ncbi:hypothetical protein JCM15548_14623 [Geofilum rubicundum JCM 15548]|uniref:Uncharacterized protein n=2 Tax=Geofilum TaxID=1236988 RepID=A0A0E9LQ81_9BACT|nr:hypothetical protein JCM15548_14623 [Geofilum rubicundum JCM 15548]
MWPYGPLHPVDPLRAEAQRKLNNGEISPQEYAMTGLKSDGAYAAGAAIGVAVALAWEGVVGFVSSVLELEPSSDGAPEVPGVEPSTTTPVENETYAPDRELPRDQHGNPQPDDEAKGTNHTQLGKKEGRKGTYNQSREFNENNEPVKDVDHTDHGRPNEHTNPHQHRYIPNETGGTKRRGRDEPLN